MAEKRKDLILALFLLAAGIAFLGLTYTAIVIMAPGSNELACTRGYYALILMNGLVSGVAGIITVGMAIATFRKSRHDETRI